MSVYGVHLFMRQGPCERLKSKLGRVGIAVPCSGYAVSMLFVWFSFDLGVLAFSVCNVRYAEIPYFYRPLKVIVVYGSLHSCLSIWLVPGDGLPCPTCCWWCRWCCCRVYLQSVPICRGSVGLRYVRYIGRSRQHRPRPALFRLLKPQIGNAWALA